MTEEDSSEKAPVPAAPSAGPSSRADLVRSLALYTAARLGLVAVVAAVVVLGARAFSVEIPLIVALVFALVIAFPLSLVLFKGLRNRVTANIAAVDEQRRIAREDLQQRLRGERD